MLTALFRYISAIDTWAVLLISTRAASILGGRALLSKRSRNPRSARPDPVLLFQMERLMKAAALGVFGVLPAAGGSGSGSKCAINATANAACELALACRRGSGSLPHRGVGSPGSQPQGLSRNKP